MSKHVHYDVHIMDPDNGHIESEDCWCEPSRAYWITGKNGQQLHVLEHNDQPLAPTPGVWPRWLGNLLDGLRKER